MQWQEDTHLWNLIAYLLSYRRIPRLSHLGSKVELPNARLGRC